MKENCNLKVIKGEVGCHGAILRENQECKIFVKKNNPLFLIDNLSDESLLDGKSSLHSSKIAIKSESENPIEEFKFSSEDEEPQFPILEYSEENIKKIQNIENLLEICSDQNSKLKILLVAGARKTGKTTLSHFLTNRLLQTNSSKVYYVETDLGQPCYSPPGFISLFEVKTPLICNKSGWNLSYLNYEKLEFIGDNSPQFYPEIYKKGLENLRNEIDDLTKKSNSDIYVVVNTHGFTQGVGYFLTKEVLEVFKPDVVAYVASEKSSEDSCLMEKIDSVNGKKLRNVKNKIIGGAIPYVKFIDLLPKSVKNQSRMVKKIERG